MSLFIIRRLFAGALTLLAVIGLTTFLMRLMPGNPFSKDRKIPPAIEKNLMARYKLDGPPLRQYADYLKDIAKGDLRLSTQYRNRSVNEIIGQTLPVSLALGATAFVLSLSLGIALGSMAAVRHHTWSDQTCMFLAVLSISIPNFVIAPLLALVFAMEWRLLPVAGWGGVEYLVLPAVCLALPYAAYVARLMRTSLLEVLQQDFVRTARAKGMAEWRVVCKHALKVALLPVVSFAGPLAANLLTGSLVIEEIFKVPGIGAFFVNSVLNRDYFLTNGVVIVYSTLLISFNLTVDILYTFLDRRIRLS
ncbi:MAG: ABC transporter permease subunit [Verrucomicrobiae bacterium]|nr:ABC transporter permease subunit [Verrucomicrobiae bacterium]